MTSANVTHYYVYNKENALIFKGSQHCMCKNHIRADLRALGLREELTLKVIWPDEYEAPHTMFYGPLADKIKEWDEEEARNEKTRQDYREMKSRGTEACLCRSEAIVGKRFKSDKDGKEFTFHCLSPRGDVILSNEGQCAPWRIMSKGDFGLNYRLV